jgi:hypothetical protein
MKPLVMMSFVRPMSNAQRSAYPRPRTTFVEDLAPQGPTLVPMLWRLIVDACGAAHGVSASRVAYVNLTLHRVR